MSLRLIQAPVPQPPRGLPHCPTALSGAPYPSERCPHVPSEGSDPPERRFEEFPRPSKGCPHTPGPPREAHPRPRHVAPRDLPVSQRRVLYRDVPVSPRPIGRLGILPRDVPVPNPNPTDESPPPSPPYPPIPPMDVPASHRPTRSREAERPEAAQGLAQPRSHREGGTEGFPAEEELRGRGVPVPSRPPQSVRHRQVVKIRQRRHRRSWERRERGSMGAGRGRGDVGTPGGRKGYVVAWRVRGGAGGAGAW